MNLRKISYAIIYLMSLSAGHATSQEDRCYTLKVSVPTNSSESKARLKTGDCVTVTLQKGNARARGDALPGIEDPAVALNNEIFVYSLGRLDALYKDWNLVFNILKNRVSITRAHDSSLPLMLNLQGDGHKIDLSISSNIPLGLESDLRQGRNDMHVHFKAPSFLGRGDVYALQTVADIEDFKERYEKVKKEHEGSAIKEGPSSKWLETLRDITNRYYHLPDPYAELGDFYAQGIGGETDLKLAAQYYRDALERASLGTQDAGELAYKLGQLYMKQHMSRDALQQLERARASGLKNPRLLVSLGLLYEENGKFEEANHAFEGAMLEGDTIAYYHRGLNHYHGNGQDANHGKALSCFREAKRLGSADPGELDRCDSSESKELIGNIAVLLQNMAKSAATELKEDQFLEANQALEKALDLGYGEAGFHRGMNHLQGNGGEIDQKKAKECFSRARELGFEHKEMNEETVDDSGEAEKREPSPGMQDYEEAIKLAGISTRNSKEEALALFHAALERNELEAKKRRNAWREVAKIEQFLTHFQKECEALKEVDDAQSYFELGTIYYEGRAEVQKDLKEARKFFEKAEAADKSHYGNSFDLCFRVGLLYRFVEPRDLEKSGGYFSRAIALDAVRAAAQLIYLPHSMHGNHITRLISPSYAPITHVHVDSGVRVDRVALEFADSSSSLSVGKRGGSAHPHPLTSEQRVTCLAWQKSDDCLQGIKLQLGPQWSAWYGKGRREDHTIPTSDAWIGLVVCHNGKGKITDIQTASLPDPSSKDS